MGQTQANGTSLEDFLVDMMSWAERPVSVPYTKMTLPPPRLN